MMPRAATCLALLATCFLGAAPLAIGQTAFGLTEEPAMRPATGANALVLQAIRYMPRGGGYAVGRMAFDGLGQAITCRGEGLTIQPAVAQPSFCSGATYLAFLHAVEAMRRTGQLQLSEPTLQALMVVGQHDGQGVWGRWNANGPGTARLFAELNLGRNFTDYESARPGDFLKIFWTTEIGAKERGHSVIYLGREVVKGVPYVRYWSSNTARKDGEIGGYGEKVVAQSKIARALFSRLERPENLARVAELPRTDAYLASMLKRRSSPEEMARMCRY